MLKDGHEGTKQRPTIACRLSLYELHTQTDALFKFPAQWIAASVRVRDAES
jgi:hypothetical protein